ncbi:MAG: hypothetical protein LBU37_09585 [Tannerellaceae bacterium]|nr:hypothetical protein [Tannerellaceae bacterium]
MSDRVRNHEKIHVAQYLECFILGFVLATFLIGYTCSLASLWLLLLPFSLYYILYLVEAGISFVHHFFAHSKKNAGRYGIAQRSAYLNSAIEMEAYDNETDFKYIEKRSWCAFIKYYGKL